MARKTKSKELGSLVLTKDHVKRIFQVFARRRDAAITELQKTKEIEPGRYTPDPSLSVTINSAGGVESQVEDDSLFDNNVMDDLKTTRLTLNYNLNFPGAVRFESASFSVSDINHATNQFTVSGSDSAWVDSFYNELSDVVSSIPPQRNPIRMFPGSQLLVRLMLTALLAYWYIRIIEWAPNFGVEPVEPSQVPDWVVGFAKFWKSAKFVFAMLVMYLPAWHTDELVQ